MPDKKISSYRVFNVGYDVSTHGMPAAAAVEHYKSVIMIADHGMPAAAAVIPQVVKNLHF